MRIESNYEGSCTKYI